MVLSSEHIASPDRGFTDCRDGRRDKMMIMAKILLDTADFEH